MKFLENLLNQLARGSIVGRNIFLQFRKEFKDLSGWAVRVSKRFKPNFYVRFERGDGEQIVVLGKVSREDIGDLKGRKSGDVKYTLRLKVPREVLGNSSGRIHGSFSSDNEEIMIFFEEEK